MNCHCRVCAGQQHLDKRAIECAVSELKSLRDSGKLTDDQYFNGLCLLGDERFTAVFVRVPKEDRGAFVASYISKPSK